jgi:hypothetical protein
LSKAKEAAAQFKHGGELIETGEKVFTKAGRAAKVIRELDEMAEACQRLADADLSDPKQQKQRARALDDLFGGAGKVASELLPDGPRSGYFTFLQGFKQYDFFGHWAEFVHNYTDRLEAASKSD